ncbi:DUF4870 domain-containing protein [Actinomadura pelletieri]|nr:DUF4870 domain-containing protein [Actinomadura pelletieri]
MWQQPQQPPPPQQPGGMGWQQPPPQPQPQGGGTVQMPSPQPGQQGPVTNDERTWSLMAYVGQFLVGAIAPAVVYLGKARTPFVRKHAVQGLNMALAAIAVWIVGGVLSLVVDVLIWVPLLFTAVVMFFLVYAGRAANRGEFRRVPTVVAWPLLKK